VSQLQPERAAALLAGIEGLDPAGVVTREDLGAIAARGACFLASGDAGSQAVYIVHIDNGVAWIDAARGSGPADWTAVLLAAIERQTAGASSVRFQTARRGLMRRALRQGYTVRGWILGKDMQ
jgi:hypothetical protein